MIHKGFRTLARRRLTWIKIRKFYESVVGFKVVVTDMIDVKEGGYLRHVFFDIGGNQFIAFLEPNGVPGVPAAYDAGINDGLGVPAGFLSCVAIFGRSASAP